MPSYHSADERSSIQNVQQTSSQAETGSRAGTLEDAPPELNYEAAQLNQLNSEDTKKITTSVENVLHGSIKGS